MIEISNLFFKELCFFTDDNNVGFLDHFLDGGFHQRSDMRNAFFEIPLICSIELCQRNFLIINGNAITFPNESFDEDDNGTFPHVISPGFETEPQNPYPRSSAVFNQAIGLFDLPSVALQNGGQHGHLNIVMFGLIEDRA